MPRFSVVVPVYNVEKYLRACLDSVVNQDFSDYELILVNDGSTDNSHKIIQEYANKYSFIKTITQNNSGSVATRKRGLEQATGEYVLILDSDDFLEIGLLNRLDKIIDKYQPDVIKLNYADAIQDERRNIYSKYQNKFFKGEEMTAIKNALLYDRDVGGLNMGIGSYSIWSTVAKRDMLLSYQSVVPDVIRIGDDTAVTTPMIYNANSIYFTDTIDYFHTINPSSIVCTFRNDELCRIEILIKYLESCLPLEMKNAICVYALKTVLSYTIFACKKLTFREFIEWANSEISDYLYERIVQANVRKLTLREKIKVRLLRKKKYKLLWKLFH